MSRAYRHVRAEAAEEEAERDHGKRSALCGEVQRRRAHRASAAARMVQDRATQKGPCE